MSDDSLLQHLQFAESKLQLISSAYFEMVTALSALAISLAHRRYAYIRSL